VEAVRAHHDARRDGLPAAQHDADRSPAAVQKHVRDGGAVAHFHAVLPGGCHEYGIEHGAARRVQGGYTGRGADLNVFGAVGIEEAGGVDGRRSRVDDCVEHAPAVQLQDAAPQQGVR
jgi:hypothetical protein